MNTKVLEDIMPTIKARAKQFLMRDWFEHAPTVYPECGTAGCIAGFILAKHLAAKANKGFSLADAHDAIGKTFAEENAKEIAGLTDAQASRLFYTSGWPAKFQRRWFYYCEGDEERAQIACERIQHFIDTEGAE